MVNNRATMRSTSVGVVLRVTAAVLVLAVGTVGKPTLLSVPAGDVKGSCRECGDGESDRMHHPAPDAETLLLPSEFWMIMSMSHNAPTPPPLITSLFSLVPLTLSHYLNHFSSFIPNPAFVRP